MDDMQDKCAGARMAFCGVRVVEVGPASLPAAPEGRTNAPRRDLTGENDTNRPHGESHPTRPLFCRVPVITSSLIAAAGLWKPRI